MVYPYEVPIFFAVNDKKRLFLRRNKKKKRYGNNNIRLQCTQYSSSKNA